MSLRDVSDAALVLELARRLEVTSTIPEQSRAPQSPDPEPPGLRLAREAAADSSGQ